MRIVSLCLVLALMVILPSRMSAEETETWGSPDSKTKEIRLTLKNGEVVQGKWSADTKDKVMLTVTTAKGKNMQSVDKNDVTKHEWVKPLEEEFKEKLMQWPADKFEAMQTYAQEMITKGFKKTYLEAMKDKQKDLTPANFKLHVYLLLNNDCVTEAKEVIAWASKEHGDWKDEIADATDRLPHANKLTSPGVTPAGPAGPVTLGPGMVPCNGKQPSTKDAPLWLEDAKKRIPDAIKVDAGPFITYDQDDPDVIFFLCATTYDAKSTGGKNTKYSLYLVYTRRAPGVFAYKETLLAPWQTFPRPN